MAITLEEVRKVLLAASTELMSKSNVVATGVGYKVTAGEQTDQLAIVCSVDVKKTKKSLTKREMIPATIQNIPTDVNPTGIIRALKDPTERFRPAPGGVSIGHVNITAGTLGCLVKKNNKISKVEIPYPVPVKSAMQLQPFSTGWRLLPVAKRAWWPRGFKWRII